MDGYPHPGYFNHSLGVFMGDQDRALPTHAQNFEAHLFVGSHSPPKI